MNALILVTRTNETEFHLFSENPAQKTIMFRTPDIACLIADGHHFFDANDLSKMYQMITSQLNDEDFGSTIMAIHPQHPSFYELNLQINSLFDAEQWGQFHVKFYSSSGNEETAPIYRDHLHPLGNLLKDQSTLAQDLTKQINKLYNDLHADEILELKLDLLHVLLSDNKRVKIPPKLIKHHSNYKDYTKALGEGNDPIAALTDLRDHLLPASHSPI